MIRTLILGVVVALGLCSGNADAQDRTTIRAQSDWTISTAPGQVTIAGWVFDCATQGQQPYNVRLYIFDRPVGPSGHYATLIARHSALPRRDVSTAFGASCGGPLSPYTGFQVTFGGIPAAYDALMLEWSNSRGVHLSPVRATIQP